MAVNFGLGPGFVTHCASYGCDNVQLKGNPDNITFHYFPKDYSLCKLWLKQCGREDLLAKGSDLRPRSFRLCSKHFTDDQYVNRNRIRKRLNANAMPSIFPEITATTDELQPTSDEHEQHSPSILKTSASGPCLKIEENFEFQELYGKPNISQELHAAQPCHSNTALGVESEVCSHYIAFIEEKAKSHRLQREVERMKEELEVAKEESKHEVESLKYDVRTLNQMIIQRNMNPDNDIVIKEEKIEFKPFDVFS